jgi:PAS domain S-box-containing protein
MKDESRTNLEQIEAIAVLKQATAESRQSESGRKQAEEEIAVLAEIGRVIGSSLDIEDVYEHFAAQAQKLVPFDRLSVDINNPDEAISVVTYVSGFDIPGRRPGDTIQSSGTISEFILKTRKGLKINLANPEEISDRYPHLTNVSTIRAGILSLISVPLISRDEVIGTLHFRSKKTNVYTERDLHLAERIGAQIAGAIANAQMFADLKKTEKSLQQAHDELEARIADRTKKLLRANEELRAEITERKRLEEEKQQEQQKTKRLAEEMAAIAEIGRVIGSSLDINEVYERFAAEARKLIPFDRISVSVINPGGNSITVAYASGFHMSSRRPGSVIPITGSVTEIFIRRQSGLIIHTESAEDLVRQFPGVTDFVMIQAGIRSMIGIPLISRDRVIGNLLFLSKMPNAYTEQDLRLAGRIGNQIAGAIAHAQLFIDLKKTEMSLRESEGRLRALVEEAPAGVAEVELGTGRFFTVNRRLCEMVGWTKEELLDATFHAITHPEDLHLHEKNKALLLAGKIRRCSLEKRYLRKDGGIVWVNITVSPLWRPGETPRRHITVIEDITERKQAEEVLQRAHEELQFKNITLQELNTTLKVLLKQREDDKIDMEERFVMNVQNLVLPFVEQMKKGCLDAGAQSCLGIIETHLRDIATPLLKNIRQFNLSPKELKVAALVRNGKSTKEIAKILGLAAGSIDTHRNNIRRKLGLKGRGKSLQSYLETLV